MVKYGQLLACMGRYRQIWANLSKYRKIWANMSKYVFKNGHMGQMWPKMANWANMA